MLTHLRNKKSIPKSRYISGSWVYNWPSCCVSNTIDDFKVHLRIVNLTSFWYTLICVLKALTLVMDRKRCWPKLGFRFRLCPPKLKADMHYKEWSLKKKSPLEVKLSNFLNLRLSNIERMSTLIFQSEFCVHVILEASKSSPFSAETFSSVHEPYRSIISQHATQSILVK